MKPLATRVPLNHKGPWPKTIQLHGSLEKMHCTKCKEVKDLDPRIFVGSGTPDCPSCTEVDRLRTGIAGKRSHGIGRLRPRIVLYNEHNPDEDAIGQVSVSDIKSSPDAVIVVGTTLKIPGVRRMVKQLCSKARGKRNGLAVWINLDPQGPQGIDFKDCFDLVVEGKADDVATLVGLPHWDEETTTFNIEELPTDQRKSEEQKMSFDRVEIQLPIASPTKNTSNSVKGTCIIKPDVRAEQGKLSFGTQSQSLGQDPRVRSKTAKDSTKPKTKKSRQSKQDVKVKSDISKAFKMTKKAVMVPAKSNKSSLLNLKGNSKVTIDSSSLPPLRPVRQNSANSRHSNVSDDDHITSSDTISPTTKPRGMEQLIN